MKLPKPLLVLKEVILKKKIVENAVFFLIALIVINTTMYLIFAKEIKSLQMHDEKLLEVLTQNLVVSLEHDLKKIFQLCSENNKKGQKTSGYNFRIIKNYQFQTKQSQGEVMQDSFEFQNLQREILMIKKYDKTLHETKEFYIDLNDIYKKIKELSLLVNVTDGFVKIGKGQINYHNHLLRLAKAGGGILIYENDIFKFQVNSKLFFASYNKIRQKYILLSLVISVIFLLFLAAKGHYVKNIVYRRLSCQNRRLSCQNRSLQRLNHSYEEKESSLKKSYSAYIEYAEFVLSDHIRKSLQISEEQLGRDNILNLLECKENLILQIERSFFKLERRTNNDSKKSTLDVLEEAISLVSYEEYKKNIFTQNKIKGFPLRRLVLGEYATKVVLVSVIYYLYKSVESGVKISYVESTQSSLYTIEIYNYSRWYRMSGALGAVWDKTNQNNFAKKHMLLPNEVKELLAIYGLAIVALQRKNVEILQIRIPFMEAFQNNEKKYYIFDGEDTFKVH